MKKLRRVGILVAVVMLVVVVVYLFEKNTDEPEKIFVIPVNSDELFISSEEGYNSIKVYRQANVLVINALSEAAFFDGVQFTVEIEGKITPEDVEIIWMTIGGNTEYVEGNDRIIAEIKISDNDELICDTKINFAKKAIDAIEDVLERNGMQYFGAILIQSELSLKELDDYYSDHRNNEWEYLVEIQEGQSIDVIDHETLNFGKEINDAGYYIVYSWESENSLLKELDIRGH